MKKSPIRELEIAKRRDKHLPDGPKCKNAKGNRAINRAQAKARMQSASRTGNR